MLRKSSVLKKLLKGGVVVLCVTGFLLQTFEFLNLYWTYPTMVDIQVTVPSEIEMPGISVCSSNAIRPDLICSLGGFCTNPRMDPFFDHCLVLPDICVNGQKPPDFRVVGYQRFFEDFEVNVTARDYLMIPLDEYFKCKIVSGGNVRKCNTENAIIGSFYSDEGVPNFCYTLFSYWMNPEAKVEKVKKSEKVEIEIFIDSSFRNRSAPLDVIQYPKWSSFSSPSFQMAIHSRYLVTSPFISGQGFLGGNNYRVKIKQDEKHLLPSPYQTNCTDYMPAWRARGGVGPLTQLMVIQECKLNATLKELGCVPFFVDYPHNETICKHCEKCSELNSIGNNCTELLRYYNQPCDFINYVMEVEEKLVNVEKLFKTEMKSEQEESITLKKKGYNCTYNKLYSNRCQTIHIEIDFDEFEITNVTYNPKFESMELFSVIGGYMGMYLGVSLVAIYDIVETALVKLFLFLKKRGKKKKKSDRRKGQRLEGYQYPRSLRKASAGPRYPGGFRKRAIGPYSPRDIY